MKHAPSAWHEQQEWLKEIEAWIGEKLSEGVVHLSWEEVSSRISGSWLWSKGFRLPTIDTKALQQQITDPDHLGTDEISKLVRQGELSEEAANELAKRCRRNFLGPPSKRDRIDDIIELARHGRLTPAQAERQAEQEHLGPLSRKPKAEFNPMKEPYWTMLMVAAWISWRTIDAVREAWNAYRREWHRWSYREDRLPGEGGAKYRLQAGHHLQPHDAVSLLWLQAKEARNPPITPVNESLSLLRERAGAAKIEGSGVRRDTKERSRQLIPAIDWRDLHWRDDIGALGPLADSAVSTVYDDVVFKRDDVLHPLWPEAGVEPAVATPLPPPGTVGPAAAECRGAFVDKYIDDCRAKGLEPTKRGIWSAYGAQKEKLDFTATRDKLENELKERGVITTKLGRPPNKRNGR